MNDDDEPRPPQPTAAESPVAPSPVEPVTPAAPVTPVTPVTPAAPVTPVTPVGTSTWRSRLYGVRAVTAVALAGLVLGGPGGAAIGYAAQDDSQVGPGHRGGPRGGFPGHPGGPGVPDGAPGSQRGGAPYGQGPSTAPQHDAPPEAAAAT